MATKEKETRGQTNQDTHIQESILLKYPNLSLSL